MSTLKLNQVVAIEKGAKTRAHEALTQLHRLSQHADLFFGLTRTYQPKTDDGDQLPSENKMVQQNVEDILNKATAQWADLQNIVLTKEKANCLAAADVVVDGKVLLPKVPVSFLVQFEKQLDDMYKFVDTLPSLPPDEEWTFNKDQILFTATPIRTARAVKITEFVVVQGSGVPEKGVKPDVKDVSKDVVVGYWDTQKLSGAMTPKRKAEILGRIESVRRAVKMAREEANNSETTMQNAFGTFFEFLFK